MSQYAIVADSLTARFGLTEFSLRAASGQITALLGPDGAGKTTFLRLVMGLLRPTKGHLTVLGDKVAYMPQNAGVYDDLTVKENLYFFATLHAVPRLERPEIFSHLLQLTRLGQFLDRPAGKLSGGMRQKLGLACALVSAPDLLLLDEPTAGVDPLSRVDLWRILTQYVREHGTTVLLATGFFDEASRSEAVYIISSGCNVTNGRPTDLAQKCTGQVFVKRHLNHPVASEISTLSAQAEVLDVRPYRGGLRVLLAAGKSLGPDWIAVSADLEDAYMACLAHGRERFGQFSQVGGKIAHMKAEKPLITVKNLVKRFGEFTAVADTSFEVYPGEIFGLLGPNGAGKTTTFRMLCGLLAPTSGQIAVAGVDLLTAKAQARAKIGYVSQFFSLYGTLSVKENLIFFGHAYGLAGQALQRRLKQIVEEFSLEPYLHTRAAELNAGYQKRLSMAAALIHDPPIVFLDEPTSGIDPQARRAFWRVICELSTQGKTIVITTHFMDEAEYCSRALIQSDGRVLALGSPSAIKKTATLDDQASMNEAFIEIVKRSEGWRP